MMPPAQERSRRAGTGWIVGRAPLAVMLAVAALVAACGTSSARYRPPSGWHDITAPTSQAAASYAISPDVPGLILACIGDQAARAGGAPPGQATVWRSDNLGGSWAQLEYLGFIAGCQITMPAGGKGTLFGESLFEATSPEQYIAYSADAGHNWSAVATTAQAAQNGQPLPGNEYEPGALQLLYAVLTRSVYRDGRLYAIGQVDRMSNGLLSAPLFSATSDYGVTWSTIEAAPDPLLRQGFVAQAIAADYRAPDAWFRVLGHGDAWLTQQEQGAGHAVDPSAPAALLEHSADGGRTWTVLGPVGPRGPLAYPGLGRATLATDPTQPARVCAAFSAWTAQGQAAPSAGAGGAPALTALVGSDDGGRTWSGGTAVQHGPNGGEAAAPGVVMDTRGDCYVGDNDVPAPATPTAQSTTAPAPTTGASASLATFWRLIPGAGATPSNIAQLAGQQLLTLGLSAKSGDPTPRLVALINTAASCPGGTCPPSSSQPHLIWMAAA